MEKSERLIMVVNSKEVVSKHLKGLIEFMDTPQVCTATPEDWREMLGDRRLEAMFVGSNLSPDDLDDLFQEIGKLDPNVPIVMLGDQAT